MVRVMETRICSTCKIEKPLTEFHMRVARGTREWWCKPCRNIYNNEHRNKDYVSPARRYVIDLKENSPCSDCHKYYPYWIMEFDHLRDKWKSIRDLYSYGLAMLKEEIAKCELVCANCHADRTYKRHPSRLGLSKYETLSA